MTVYFKLIHLDHGARTYLDLKVDKTDPSTKPQKSPTSPEVHISSIKLLNLSSQEQVVYITAITLKVIMKAILCSTEDRQKPPTPEVVMKLILCF